jgi:hypothetical protein
MQTARKYVYVFVIDKYGNMQPLYPDEREGNGENLFPAFDPLKGNSLVRDVKLCDTYRVTIPSGTDNYFLLATEEAIPNSRSLFTQEGVQRGLNYTTVLGQLLELGNESTRGFSSLPKTWNLKRFPIHCTY